MADSSVIKQVKAAAIELDELDSFAGTKQTVPETERDPQGKHWVHRLVRCEVNIASKEIRFYGLRRREPDSQPLLRKVAYELPSTYIS